MTMVSTRREQEVPPFASDDERWAAGVRRDRRADGIFFYSVRTTGVTPKAYAAAHRARRVRDELSRSDTVTEAIYGAGCALLAREAGS